jgi:dephospho-CoA kinase
MYCVGVTGNIASGKTTTLGLFQILGAHIISADKIARKLTDINQPALIAIKNHFGESIITSTGHLDRAALRKIIFNNSAERIWLEALLHPLIRNAIQAEIVNLSKFQVPYCLIEIPLLKSKEDYPYLNRVLVLLSDADTQIKRIIKRDCVDKAHAEAILSTQPSIENMIHLADDQLNNNETNEKLLKSIKKLHKKYLQLASEKSS